MWMQQKAESESTLTSISYIQEAIIDDKVKEFCDLYMPSYQIYLDTLYANGIEGVPSCRTFKFMIDANREPYICNEPIPVQEEECYANYTE